MSRIIKYIFWALAILLLVVLAYFFIGWASQPQNTVWGVNFSQKHAKDLGLDWRESYSAILDDLKAKNLKVAVHWDVIEPSRNSYNFSDIDWQVNEAQKRQAKLILIIGMKTSRWPECHLPEWAKGLAKEDQQSAILAEIEALVVRYRDNPSLLAWQPENEALFSFGECPWIDQEFLEKEVALVKKLDPEHPVVVTDSGEGSFWFKAAKIGDIVGITTYRKVWMSPLNSYLDYPIPPVFYYRKAQLVKALFNKEVWSVELQAEPWCPVLL
jgi:endo-1,4-beta-mannosidase